MGSSDKAGNRGKPATPRDGSAIELIGLSKAVITWLNKLYNQKKYPYSGVQRTHKNGSVTKWSFKEWSEKIQTSFEKYFWVNTTPIDGEIRQDLINKRGIYKDIYGSSESFPDFQLRCNFPIAMVVVCRKKILYVTTMFILMFPRLQNYSHQNMHGRLYHKLRSTY